MERNPCERVAFVPAYALRALPEHVRWTMEAHLASCLHCSRELGALRPAVEALASSQPDLERPASPLQARLACLIAAETGQTTVLPSQPPAPEPAWEDVAPGIAVQMLSQDTENGMISMLVRLAPGGEYPAHTHAGIEELHLLDGELWIDDRKLQAGDYNRAEPGTGDKRVWSETGCTCVLVTSTRDILAS